jgi:hypothetical protein
MCNRIRLWRGLDQLEREDIMRGVVGVNYSQERSTRASMFKLNLEFYF